MAVRLRGYASLHVWLCVVNMFFVHFECVVMRIRMVQVHPLAPLAGAHRLRDRPGSGHGVCAGQ